MRITDTNRLNRSNASKTKKSEKSGGQKFEVSEQQTETQNVQVSVPTQEVGSIDALLALQAVEDPIFAKKKSIKRGHDLLDGLEQIKTDLLVGRLSQNRLDNMLQRVKSARQKGDPQLDEIIDEIELRVRVELAKFEKF